MSDILTREKKAEERQMDSGDGETAGNKAPYRR